MYNMTCIGIIFTHSCLFPNMKTNKCTYLPVKYNSKYVLPFSFCRHYLNKIIYKTQEEEHHQINNDYGCKIILHFFKRYTG